MGRHPVLIGKKFCVINKAIRVGSHVIERRNSRGAVPDFGTKDLKRETPPTHWNSSERASEFKVLGYSSKS